ncbi:hypothetical protein FBU30_008185 [Linnemannia zychae]|nr:hypothetical protein FBU30_008185 [Linnemannia zychae]
MLLLVPSHKADDESTGRDMNSASRVLVLLSSDTDISANVVVPDTAITTTLGTSDTIETAADGYSQSSYFNPPSAYLTQWKHGREYHDGIQPSRHDSSFGGFQQPTQQPNVHQERRLISQLDQRTLHLYGGSDPNNNRTRRHSHTGLVEFDHFAGPTSSTIRMRARQSISLGAPYQNQSLRTPRLLRGAFRKARKDQSPLLTSASFGTDYATQIPVEEWEGDDLLLPWKAHSSAVDDTSHSSVLTSSSSPKALTHGDRPFSHLTNPRDEHHESDIINNKNDADLDSFDSCDDVDVDGEDNDNNHSLSKIKSPSNPSVLSEQGHRDSSEIVDIDGLSDEEMITDESSRVPLVVNSPICSRTRVGQWIEDGFKKAGQEDRTELDIDMDNDLDADMDTILGMTSDMELIMPEFDDEYLQDLNNDLGQGTHMRGHSTSFSNVASPSFSQSSSTTITCLSSHSSPFPSMSTDSPGSTTLNHGETSLQQSEHQQMKQHSINQDLSSFHRDIDILRRHREELKKSPTQSAESSNTKSETRSMSPSGSNTVARSSLVSSPTLTDKQDKPTARYIWGKRTASSAGCGASPFKSMGDKE